MHRIYVIYIAMDAFWYRLLSGVHCSKYDMNCTIIEGL
jgi:hypothetical protein